METIVPDMMGFMSNGWITYGQYCDQLEGRILQWANPSGEYLQSPLRAYPLTSLRVISLFVLAYLSSILILTCLMKTIHRPMVSFVKGLQYLYNPVQMILCSYMCLETMMLGLRHDYSLTCNVVNYAQPVMGRLLWLFMVSKILDFVDTYLIILSCKWRQLTLLHVYHHASVLLVFWFNLALAYDGDIYITILLNSGVHAVMYTYYFLSLHCQHPIWWKRYLTMLQILQFVMYNIHGYVLYRCAQFPVQIALTYIIYVQSLLWLFIHFFTRSYYGGAIPTSKAKKTH